MEIKLYLFIEKYTNHTLMWMSILNFPSGNSCCNLVRMQSPIKVAKEQWGTVGTKAILITNRPGDSVNSGKVKIGEC